MPQYWHIVILDQGACLEGYTIWYKILVKFFFIFFPQKKTPLAEFLTLVMMLAQEPVTSGYIIWWQRYLRCVFSGTQGSHKIRAFKWSSHTHLQQTVWSECRKTVTKTGPCLHCTKSDKSRSLSSRCQHFSCREQYQTRKHKNSHFGEWWEFWKYPWSEKRAWN